MNARGVRFGVATLALAGLFAASRSIDWTRALATLAHLGGKAPLVVLPYVLVLCFDTLGWRLAFERARGIGFWSLWRVRVATDAVSNSLPAGVALAEALKAVILQRRFALGLADATANVVISKFALAISQALFLFAGLLLAAPTLQQNSRAMLGRDGLEWAAFGVALVFLLAMTLSFVALTRGTLLVRVLTWIQHLAGHRLRGSIDRLMPMLSRLDQSFAFISRIPRTQTLASIAMFSCGWLALAFENFIILTLLNTGISAGDALAMEAIVSVIRIVFFFIPSALGAQEVGYYMLLRAYGVVDPVATTAAFMIAKRAKELLWIGIGYVALWSLQFRVKDAYAQASSAEAPST